MIGAQPGLSFGSWRETLFTAPRAVNCRRETAGGKAGNIQKYRMAVIKKLHIVILLSQTVACASDPVKTAPPAVPVHYSEAALISQLEEIRRMQALVEQSLVLRAKAIRFYRAHALKEKRAEREIPLTQDELVRLYDGAVAYLGVREALKGIALKHSWLAEPDRRVIFSGPGQKVGHAEGEGRISVSDRLPLQVDIASREGRLLMLQLKTSLGAALVLYDNYLMGVYPFTKNRKYSYLFNRDFRSYLTGQANQYRDKSSVQKLRYKIASLVTVTGKLDELTGSYLNGAQREKIVAAMEILIHYDQALKSMPAYRVTDEEEYLDLLREQSFTYRYIRKKGRFGAGSWPLRRRLSQIEENLLFFSKAFSFIVSEGFGNGVGLVAFREGKLKKLPVEEKRAIAGQLRPLDILLEKTPFRLTDALIPGHFGHVAVWVGGYSEFEKLGLAGHPLVRKYAKELRSGHSVVEALRSGVQMNSLEHFLNIDDLAVLRPGNLSLAEQREYLIRALRQVGKEYDFNFNVETDEDVVCSELAYTVFKNIDWPTKKSWGRFTISPDHIAKKALDGAFEVRLIYHDGRKVDGDLRRALSALLRTSPVQD
jgi:hypothetical protein